MAAVIVDIDGLIWLNDSMGFEVGDAAVSKLGKWLGETADIHGGRAFRIRGEEFLLLMPRHEYKTIACYAEYLINECRKLGIPYSRMDVQRDYLAINAVVFTANQETLNWISNLESEVSDIVRRAIYEEKKKTGKSHSVVAKVEMWGRIENCVGQPIQ